jgi:hypothetical protein
LTCIYVGFEFGEKKLEQEKEESSIMLPELPHKVIKLISRNSDYDGDLGSLARAKAFSGNCNSAFELCTVPSFQLHTHLRCGGRMMVAYHHARTVHMKNYLPSTCNTY